MYVIVHEQESRYMIFESSSFKKNSTGEKILQSAQELFFQNGIENTSVRLLAQKANVNLGSITYYFDGKNDIADHIYAQTMNRLVSYFPVDKDGFLSQHDFFFFEMCHFKLLLVNSRFLELYCLCSNDEKIDLPAQKWVSGHIHRYCNHDKNDSWFMLSSYYVLKGIKRESAVLYYRQPDDNKPHISKILSGYMDTLIQFIFPPEVHGGFPDLDRYRDNLIAEFENWYINLVAGYTPVLVKKI